MSRQAGQTNRLALGLSGIAAVALVGFALYLSGLIGPSDPVTPEPVVSQKAEPVVAEAQPEPVVVLPDPPKIDTFRLEPDGRMLVAGQAHPDWQTSILVDGIALAQVTPDSAG